MLQHLPSLPVRECGLKFKEYGFALAQRVTPCAGVWIEIAIDSAKQYPKRSLPVRECGLKSS